MLPKVGEKLLLLTLTVSLLTQPLHSESLRSREKGETYTTLKAYLAPRGIFKGDNNRDLKEEEKTFLQELLKKERELPESIKETLENLIKVGAFKTDKKEEIQKFLEKLSKVKKVSSGYEDDYAPMRQATEALNSLSKQSQIKDYVTLLNPELLTLIIEKSGHHAPLAIRNLEELIKTHSETKPSHPLKEEHIKQIIDGTSKEATPWAILIYKDLMENKLSKKENIDEVLSFAIKQGKAIEHEYQFYQGAIKALSNIGIIRSDNLDALETFISKYYKVRKKKKGYNHSGYDYAPRRFALDELASLDQEENIEEYADIVNLDLLGTLAEISGKDTHKGIQKLKELLASEHSTKDSYWLQKDYLLEIIEKTKDKEASWAIGILSILVQGGIAKEEDKETLKEFTKKVGGQIGVIFEKFEAPLKNLIRKGKIKAGELEKTEKLIKTIFELKTRETASGLDGSYKYNDYKCRTKALENLALITAGESFKEAPFLLDIDLLEALIKKADSKTAEALLALEDLATSESAKKNPFILKKENILKIIEGSQKGLVHRTLQSLQILSDNKLITEENLSEALTIATDLGNTLKKTLEEFIPVINDLSKIGQIRPDNLDQARKVLKTIHKLRIVRESMGLDHMEKYNDFTCRSEALQAIQDLANDKHIKQKPELLNLEIIEAIVIKAWSNTQESLKSYKELVTDKIFRFEKEISKDLLIKLIRASETGSLNSSFEAFKLLIKNKLLTSSNSEDIVEFAVAVGDKLKEFIQNIEQVFETLVKEKIITEENLKEAKDLLIALKEMNIIENDGGKAGKAVVGKKYNTQTFQNLEDLAKSLTVEEKEKHRELLSPATLANLINKAKTKSEPALKAYKKLIKTKSPHKDKVTKENLQSLIEKSPRDKVQGSLQMFRFFLESDKGEKLSTVKLEEETLKITKMLKGDFNEIVAILETLSEKGMLEGEDFQKALDLLQNIGKIKTKKADKNPNKNLDAALESLKKVIQLEEFNKIPPLQDFDLLTAILQKNKADTSHSLLTLENYLQNEEIQKHPKLLEKDYLLDIVNRSKKPGYTSLILGQIIHLVELGATEENTIEEITNTAIEVINKIGGNINSNTHQLDGARKSISLLCKAQNIKISDLAGAKSLLISLGNLILYTQSIGSVEWEVSQLLELEIVQQNSQLFDLELFERLARSYKGKLPSILTDYKDILKSDNFSKNQEFISSIFLKHLKDDDQNLVKLKYLTELVGRGLIQEENLKEGLELLNVLGEKAEEFGDLDFAAQPLILLLELGTINRDNLGEFTEFFKLLFQEKGREGGGHYPFNYINIFLGEMKSQRQHIELARLPFLTTLSRSIVNKSLASRILKVLFPFASEANNTSLLAIRGLKKLLENREVPITHKTVREFIEAINILESIKGRGMPIVNFIHYLSRSEGDLTPLEKVRTFLKIKPWYQKIWEWFLRLLNKEIKDPLNQDIVYLFLPTEIREQIDQTENIDTLFKKVTLENYQEEPNAAYLYLKIRKDISASLGLSYQDFKEIIENGKPTPYTGIILEYVNTWLHKTESTLGEQEKKDIIQLSIALHKSMIKMGEKQKLSGISTLTFRDLVRFNVDFSKYYLRQQGMENVLELFILASHHIYGRLIQNPKSKSEFISIIANLLSSENHNELFGKAQVRSKTLQQGGVEETINRIIDYSDYDQIESTRGKDDIPIDHKIKALINRASQVSRPALFLLNNDNSHYLEEALKNLDSSENQVIPISLSGFTKRQELFGMYLPRESMSKGEIQEQLEEASDQDIKEALKNILNLKDSEIENYLEEYKAKNLQETDQAIRNAIASYLKNKGNWKDQFKWHDGLLVKLSQKAEANPEKKYHLIFKNIDALPDQVRVQLNPVIWEKVVEIPDRGMKLNLPSNLNMIFTMHKDREIKDDSFLNRPLVHHLPELEDLDIKNTLIHKNGLSTTQSQRATQIFQDLKKLETTLKEPIKITLNDILEIAKRVKGLEKDGVKSKGNEFLEKEAYNYLYLRAKSKSDRELIREQVFQGKEFPKPTLKIKGNQIQFDQVTLPLSEELSQYVRDHSKDKAEKIFLDYFGYVVTETEIRVMSQLARGLKYASKAMQIEGPSGEGKTEIGRVFSKTIGYSTREKTINEDTDLGEFVGQIRPTKEGGYSLHRSKYPEQLEKGENIFLMNEINTNRDSSLYHWLHPENTGQQEKLLPEFASTSEDEIIKKVQINQNNLWLYTINPQTFQGRGATPEIVQSHIPSFHMAMDLEDLPEVIEGFVTEKGLKEKLDQPKKYIKQLSSIHRQIKESKSKYHLNSNQDITRREVIRAIDKFTKYLDQGKAEDEAFKTAIYEIYVYPWQELTDIDKVKSIVKEELNDQKEISKEAVLKASLRENRPLLIFHNALSSLEQIKKNIIEERQGDSFESIPMSYFHRKRQFLGGFIPREKSEDNILKGEKWKEASPAFDLGLGLIPKLIEKARLDNTRNHTIFFENYTHINPQVAPLLNEFFQTGRLPEVEEMLTPASIDRLYKKLEEGKKSTWKDQRKKYKDATGKELPESQGDLTPDSEAFIEYVKWFYTQAPDNLKVIALGSSQETVNLSEAEIDRFLAINLSSSETNNWDQKYISKNLPKDLQKIKKDLQKNVREIHQIYQKQAQNGEYDWNRLSQEDIDTLIKELQYQQNTQGKELTQEYIKKITYYTLGMGIRDQSARENDDTKYRGELSFERKIAYPENLINFIEKEDGIYLNVDGIEIKTSHQTLPENDYLVPTRNLVKQLASMIIGMRHGRPIIAEGFPGGGKTDSSRDLGERLGLTKLLGYSPDKILMYDEIDLGEFLGKLSKKGKDFVLTASKGPDGKYLLPFLKAYTEGGIYVLDEGAMGMNSAEAISFLVELTQLQEFDLGTFHPGKRGETVKKHPNFQLVITQNPAKTTKGREPLPYRVDTQCHKIWTSNVLEPDDATRIIDHYLKDQKDKLPKDIKEKLGQLHRRFIDIHPHKSELSPRQLIMVTKVLKGAMDRGLDLEQALFRGIMIAYLSRLKAEQIALILKEEAFKEIFRDKFKTFLKEWEKPLNVTEEKEEILINDIPIKKNAKPGNIKKEDLFLRENNLPSQSRSIRELALGTSLNIPVALLEEDGADALDLVKKFCEVSGYQLETLWSHPQMSKMHLLSTLLPKFKNGLNERGIKEESLSSDFLIALGFLTRNLISEEEKAKGTKEKRQEKVLFFNMMDAIPERQRVLLNEILTTRKIVLQDEKGEAKTYHLPDWVHIVVSASEDHNFASAFINRFLQVRIPFLSLKEGKKAVKTRYPLVRDKEIEWIYRISEAVWKHEKKGIFGLKYGYSPRDLFKLARMVQVEKQRDIQKGIFNKNPLHYVLKASFIMYMQGLEEGDKEKFEERIIKGYLLKQVLNTSEDKIETLWAQMKSDYWYDMTRIEQETHTITIQEKEVEQGAIKLENGITLEKKGENYLLKTPGNLYQITEEELQKGKTLSSEVTIKAKAGQIYLKLLLTKTVGGVPFKRDIWNKERSLPEGEVSTNEYIRYTSLIRRMTSSMLRYWQPIKDSLGTVRLPRVVMLNGETGAAKTTLIRNLSKVWGVPTYTLNAYEDLKVSDATIGMKMKQGKLEVGIKEFLARMGKINGQRIKLQGKESSSRSILLIDEANASPDLLYALTPLFKGQKKFKVEYGGESYDVDLDQEVMVVLTFNPAEKYSGRGGFAREIISHAEKIWAPNPLDYSEEVLGEVLSEYHRRGITKVRKKLQETLSSHSKKISQGHQDIQAEILQIQDLEHPEVDPIDTLLNQKKTYVQVKETKIKNKTMDSKMEKGEEVIDESAKEKPKGEKQKIYYPYNLEPTHYRDNVYDQVEGLELASSYKSEERVKIEERVNPSYEPIQGNLSINITDKWKQLPSPAPGDMININHYKAIDKKGTPIEVEFSYGEKTGNLYIRSKEKYKGPIKLEYTAGINHHVYYGNTIPKDKTITQEDPGQIPEQIKNLLEENPIKGNSYNLETIQAKPRQFIYDLIHEFRDYTLEENGIEKHGRGNHVFEKIITSRCGVCRHRAYAFHVLAKNQGFKTRYIENQIHAFVEIHIQNHGWVRLDLGGGGDPANNDYSEKRETKAVEQKGDLPEPQSENYKRQQEQYKRRMEEAQNKSGQNQESQNQEDQEKASGETKEESKGDINKEGLGKSRKSGQEKDTQDTDPQKSADLEAPEKSEDREKTEDQNQEDNTLDTMEIQNQGTKTDIELLLELAPKDVEKFLEVYAGESKVIKEPSDEGDEPDIERILTSPEEGFQRIKTIKQLGSGSFGITIDISGSTQGYLAAQFMRMVRLFSSLYYQAALKNKKIDFSIGGLGTNYHHFLDFKDSRDYTTIKNKLSTVENKLATEGTNIAKAIDEIIRKHKERPQQNKLEVIFTDGDDYSGVPLTKQLNRLKEAHQLGIDIVFIGIGKEAASVRDYPKSILLGKTPEYIDMLQLIIQLSLLKNKSGMLPEGQLDHSLTGLEILEKADQSKKILSAIGKEIKIKEIKLEGDQLTLHTEEEGRKENPYKLTTTDQEAPKLSDIEKVSAKEHRPLLRKILNPIENQRVHYKSFRGFHGDIMGLASPETQSIAIYENLQTQDKLREIAQFHEIAHYLLDQKEKALLEIKWTGTQESPRLKIKTRQEEQTTEEELKLSPETQTFIKEENWPEGWQQEDHYLLRVLQREIFKDQDKALTQKIQEEKQKKQKLQKAWAHYLDKILQSTSQEESQEEKTLLEQTAKTYPWMASQIKSLSEQIRGLNGASAIEKLQYIEWYLKENQIDPRLLIQNIENKMQSSTNREKLSKAA